MILPDTWCKRRCMVDHVNTCPALYMYSRAVAPKDREMVMMRCEQYRYLWE